MPEAYVGNPKIDFDAGPIHVSLLDKEAVFSFAEGLYDLLRTAQRAYPDLDKALREQREDRRRELQQEVADREYANGGMTRLERAMHQAQMGVDL